MLVSSTAGQRGEAYHADYAASKGAMISFVKSLAVELASRDITVNAVAPGWVDTEMVAEALESEGRDRIAKRDPGRASGDAARHCRARSCFCARSSLGTSRARF